MGDAGYNLTLVLARFTAFDRPGRNFAIHRLGDGDDGDVILFCSNMNNVIGRDKSFARREGDLAIAFGKVAVVVAARTNISILEGKAPIGGRSF